MNVAQHQAAVNALSLPCPVTVEYRPRRRSAGLSVRDGAVVLAVPPGAAPERLAAFVDAHRGWIAAALRDQKAVLGNRPVKHMKDGEVIPFLGCTYRLRVDDDGQQELPCALDPSTGDLVIRHYAGAAHMRAALLRWYTAAGLEWLHEAAEPFTKGGYIKPGLRFVVRDLGSRRWGLYEPKHHRLTVHWLTLTLPRDLAFYVLIHELAHATRPMGKPHGPAWQRQFTIWLPDWRARRQQLRALERAGTLWMGDVHPDSAT